MIITTQYKGRDQEINFLLVDDDNLDRMAISRKFKKKGIENKVYEAEHGQIALDMLRGEKGHDPLPRPCMVLLDLNMPIMNGIEFLSALRADPSLKQTIVFVHTTSVAEQDKHKAYELQIAGYLTKWQDDTNLEHDLADFMKLYCQTVVFPDA